MNDYEHVPSCVHDLERFFCKNPSPDVDWAMLATQLAFEVARNTGNGGHWVRYYYLKDYRDQLKVTTNWEHPNKVRARERKQANVLRQDL